MRNNIINIAGDNEKDILISQQNNRIKELEEQNKQLLEEFELYLNNPKTRALPSVSDRAVKFINSARK